jgi:hypothetical protein
VAEQIPSLDKKDIKFINNAKSIPCLFDSVTEQGKKNLEKIFQSELITGNIKQQEAYQFIAGLGIEELKRHLINRELQNLLQKEKISVETAQIIANTINGSPVSIIGQKFLKQ